MDSRPLRIQMLGLLPLVLRPCGPSCAQPFMNESVARLSEEEMRETPAIVRENGDRAHALAEQLFRDFGNNIRIEVVGLDSPRGAWYALRHRVGKGFAVVVDGRDVFRSPEAYAPLKDAVERGLRARGMGTG